MTEFFRGWKHKAGLVTLIAASLFSTLWVRSRMVNDQLLIRRSMKGYEVLESVDGRLIWGRFYSAQTAGTTPMQVVWPVWESRHRSDTANSIFSNPSIRADGWQWCGIGAATSGRYYPLLGQTSITVAGICYGSLVIPLTLVSASLLLSRHDKRFLTRFPQL